MGKEENMEGQSILMGGWTEVLYGITQIMTVPVAALGLTLPIIGLVVSVAKRLFRSKRG